MSSNVTSGPSGILPPAMCSVLAGRQRLFLGLDRLGGVGPGLVFLAELLDAAYRQPGRTFPFTGRQARLGAQALARGGDRRAVLGQPLGLRDQQVVDHLRDLRRRAHGADQRVQHHGLHQQPVVTAHRGLDRETLHGDAGVADRGAAEGKVAHPRDVEPGAVDVARHLDAGVIRQVGDAAAVLDVEVAAVDASSLQSLQDVGAVLGRAVLGGVPLRGLGHPAREVLLEPVAPLA